MLSRNWVRNHAFRRGGAVELVVLGRIQLDQQLRFRTVGRVLKGLQSVELLAHVTTFQRPRGGAHRVKCGPRVHT